MRRGCGLGHKFAPKCDNGRLDLVSRSVAETRSLRQEIDRGGKRGAFFVPERTIGEQRGELAPSHSKFSHTT